MSKEHPSQSSLAQANSDPYVYAEGVSTFDTLNEPDAIAKTLEVFRTDRLLARAIDGPMVARRGGGEGQREFYLDFYVVNNELGLMAADRGMKHTSTTLLVAGESVGVYKSFGFLASSDRTEVEHVSDHDSGSNVTNDILSASESDLETLDELAQRVHETRTRDMNEVNVTLPINALRGIFANDFPRPKLDALATQRYIQEQGKGLLPLFIYNQEQGSLVPWQPNAEEVRQLVDTMHMELMRDIYTSSVVVDSMGSTAVAASLK